MRRALLLLAAVAAPAAAQTLQVGVVSFTDGTKDLVHGPWISKAECQQAKANARGDVNFAIVNLSWIELPINGATFPANGKYQVYAATRDVVGADGKCPTLDNTGGTAGDYKAGPVGAAITGQNQTVSLAPAKIADILAAVKIADCETAAASGDVSIFICVQAISSDGTTDTPIGFAKGTIKLSILAPAAPTGLGATPADDGALTVSWTAPTGDPLAYDYVVEAVNAAGDTHTRGDITAQSVTLTGMTNDVPYTITVTPRSQAGNPGPAATTTGTPVAVANFWDAYQAAGGREQGGCAAGAAGPVALLGVAALLARLRRRS